LFGSQSQAILSSRGMPLVSAKGFEESVMIKVAQVTVFNIFVSYVMIQLSLSFDDTGSVGELIVRVFFGLLYLYSLWGLAAKWFAYEGDNVVIQWLWVASLMPAWQLVLLYWILD